MKDLDKKSNNELQSLKTELTVNFEKTKLDIVNLYDYWKSIENDYIKVVDELRKRGIV